MLLKRAGMVLLTAVLTVLPGAVRAQTPAPAAPVRAIAPTLECQSDSSTAADFNGDGTDDVAIGAPLDDVAKSKDVGSLNIVYGADGDGLDSTTDKLLSPATPGLPALRWMFGSGRLFGKALAAGDFNDDNVTDLAVGMPGAPVDDIANTGAVLVFYGTPTGLVTQTVQILHQDLPGMPEHNDKGDSFGWTLAAGDFNGDGADDLAISAPGEDFGSIKDGGAVWTVYGKAGPRSSGGGLAPTGGVRASQLLVQGARGLYETFDPGDLFGLALATGNFDGDSEANKPIDDLAIGVPQEDIGIRADTGGVQVLYGSSGGLSTDNLFWHQGSPNIEGANETGDLYGCALAAGNFDGAKNGTFDVDNLAVGVPGEDLTKSNQGGVAVVYSVPGSGLSATAGPGGDQFFIERPGFAGLQEQAEASARFGQSLNAQNIDKSTMATQTAWELAIGVPGAAGGTGQVFVIGGVLGTGLRDLADNSYSLSANTLGTHRAGNPGDEFGRTLAFGDYDKDADLDLVIGAPGDSSCGTFNETGEFLSIGPGIPLSSDAVKKAGAALSLYSDGSSIDPFSGTFPSLTPPGLGNWSLTRCDLVAEATSIYGLTGDPQADAQFSQTIAGL